LFGQLPKMVYVGELRVGWYRGVKLNIICTCGQPFLDCPFWISVGNKAFGGWDQIDAEEVNNLGRHIRQRFFPILATPGLRPKATKEIESYVDHLSRMYEAISAVSGGAAVVDSQKDPALAFVLRQDPRIDLKLVRLVRDSRGVAFSRTKKIPFPEMAGMMITATPAGTALHWAVYNILFDILISRVRMPAASVRYEDLIGSTPSELIRILSELDLPVDAAGLSFLSGGSANLTASHTLTGNPMRFKSGPTPLKLDEEWRTQLSPLDRFIVAAITWPLLRKYGYLRPKSPGSA